MIRLSLSPLRPSLILYPTFPLWILCRPSCSSAGLSIIIIDCLVGFVLYPCVVHPQCASSAGFRTYYGMASKMSADLALQDSNYDPMSEYERSRRRATWAGMVQLHMTANSCKHVLLSSMNYAAQASRLVRS